MKKMLSMVLGATPLWLGVGVGAALAVPKNSPNVTVQGGSASGGSSAGGSAASQPQAWKMPAQGGACPAGYTLFSNECYATSALGLLGMPPKPNGTCNTPDMAIVNGLCRNR